MQDISGIGAPNCKILLFVPFGRYMSCVKLTPQQTQLDEIDLSIIEHLKRNARSTYGDIATVVGLSAPAVKRRMDRLEEQRVILGYTAVVDTALLGRPFEAFTELRFSGDARVDEIAHIADDIPEVEAVFTVAGDPDALAWIRVTDVQDLKRVVDKLRASGHVIGTKTMMALGTSVGTRSYAPGRGWMPR